MPVEHTDDSATAGKRGPTLIEDFHFREKLTRFDHERIPERVVHARGAGAYGCFECTESLADVTRADFLGRSVADARVRPFLDRRRARVARRTPSATSAAL